MGRIQLVLAFASIVVICLHSARAVEPEKVPFSGGRASVQSRVSDHQPQELLAPQEAAESQIDQEIAQTQQRLADLREQAERIQAAREQARHQPAELAIRATSLQAEEPLGDKPEFGRGASEPMPEYLVEEPCAVSGACCGTTHHSGNGLWFRAEYLAWWTSGMSTPPLLTQAPRGNPAILGQGGEVIFGGDDMLDEIRHGARFRAGMWLDECRLWGLESEYLFLGSASESACEGSGGEDRTVARPFIDAITGRPTTELVGFLPPVGGALSGSRAVAGCAHIELNSDFQSAGVRLRRAYSAAFDCAGNGHRLDMLAGYRFTKLNEGLSIYEDLTSLDPASPNTAFDIFDRFGTKNEFHGLDLGLIWYGQLDRWSLEVLTKAAIGNNHREIDINGRTTLTNTANGQTLTSTVSVPPDGAGTGQYTGGGLLAQRPNIGRHQSDQFTAIPEIGLTLGYDVNQHVRATFGYSLIVFPKVFRPGDQIDPHVNVAYLPDELSPITGPQRPGLLSKETTFWTQGLNAGLEFRW